MYVFLSQTLSESISSIQGGVVATPGYDEIVACTYAGKYHIKPIGLFHLT